MLLTTLLMPLCVWGSFTAIKERVREYYAWLVLLEAAMIGVFSNVTGLYISYYWNIASGPTMVLVATFFFLLVFIFAPERGVLWRSLHRAQVRAV